MGLEPLQSTVAPFEWSVMHQVEAHPSPRSTWTSNWAAGRELLERQRNYLLGSGLDLMELERQRFADAKFVEWTPLVDLALGRPDTTAWHSGRPYIPARSICSIAEGGTPGRLVRGTPLQYFEAQPDLSYEAMGNFVWSVAGLDVPYIHSAMEGRWGGAALLADALIVPRDHPWVGDDAQADKLVLNLREIVLDFRRVNGLQLDGLVSASTVQT